MYETVYIGLLGKSETNDIDSTLGRPRSQGYSQLKRGAGGNADAPQIGGAQTVA